MSTEPRRCRAARRDARRGEWTGSAGVQRGLGTSPLDRPLAGRQPVPVRHLRADPRRDPEGGGVVTVEVTRRGFLAGLGAASAGLALGWRILDAGDAAAEATATGAAGASVFAPNPFIQIGVDGVVTIVCARSEMGQGIRSSLPVLIADELGADPAKIRVVQGDADEVRRSEHRRLDQHPQLLRPDAPGRRHGARDADRRRRGALARPRRAAHRARRRGPRSADPQVARVRRARRRGRRAAGPEDRRAAPAEASSPTSAPTCRCATAPTTSPAGPRTAPTSACPAC